MITYFILICLLVLTLLIIISFNIKKYDGGVEYVDWTTDNQIMTVFNTSYKNQLLKLLSKIYKNNDLTEIIQYNKKDSLIFQAIKMPIKIAERKKERVIYQSIHYMNCLKNVKLPVIHNYLDVGCGDGSVTAEFASRINAKNKFCVDVKQPEDSQPDIKYHILTNTIKFPYKDNFMDFISCFMVLHHVKPLEEELKEIYRVMRPGGLLFIREHDCRNDIEAMLVDIEHTMYINFNNEKDKDPYMFHYKTMSDWNQTIEQLGFKLLTSNYYGPVITITRSFYSVFQKPL
jgi:SAM-dependent methyltransferase